MRALIQTVPNIRALAKRTFPMSEKAQDIFTLEHVTKAAARLGHEDPETDAQDAIDAHDQSLEMPLDQESDEPEPDAEPEPEKPVHLNKPKKDKKKSRRG